MLVQVSSSLQVFEPLTYNYQGDPASLKPGMRVVVPLGNRLTTGWIIDTQSSYKGRVKNITAVVRDEYVPDRQFLAFTGAVAGLYFTSGGSLLEAALPPKYKSIDSICFANRDKQGKIEKLTRTPLPQLQQLSKEGTIDGFYKVKAAPAREPEPAPRQAPDESMTIVRDGPGLSEANNSILTAGHCGPVENESPAELRRTGQCSLAAYERISHYCRLIEENLQKGRSVLITVPDNLTAQYLREKLQENNIEADLYNSGVKTRERDVLWTGYAQDGKVGVVMGGLSAVLLPIKNLGLIICERAGTGLYKRSFHTPYDVHILSRLRAEQSQLPLVEGFSTCTVQAYQNRTQVLIEDKRPEKIPITVHVIKGGTRGIPANFQETLVNYFHENKKILVVLNKKESYNFLFCEKCKKMQYCPECQGIIDVAGEEEFRSKCRRCGREKESFSTCPKCGETLALSEIVSIASLKKYMETRLTETGIMTLAAEGLKEDHIHSILQQVRESKIVIATPVIINPFFNHIFDVILYLRPESFFNLDEHDAAERIFSMSAEFREMVKSGGAIDIFSTFHFHYALKLVNEEENFFERELKYREWFHLPPFFNVYNIEIRGKDLRGLAAGMRSIYKSFKETLKIKRVYLFSRQPARSKFKYKGIIEAHARPEAILASGLLGNRDISVDLVMI